MDLNRPGKKYPDGMFIFDEPVKVKVSDSRKRTLAIGFNKSCPCGPCVYVEPWPDRQDKTSYAYKSWNLEEIE